MPHCNERGGADRVGYGVSRGPPRKANSQSSRKRTSEVAKQRCGKYQQQGRGTGPQREVQSGKQHPSGSITRLEGTAATLAKNACRFNFREHDPEKWVPVFRKDH